MNSSISAEAEGGGTMVEELRPIRSVWECEKIERTNSGGKRWRCLWCNTSYSGENSRRALVHVSKEYRPGNPHMKLCEADIALPYLNRYRALLQFKDNKKVAATDKEIDENQVKSTEKKRAMKRKSHPGTLLESNDNRKLVKTEAVESTDQEIGENQVKVAEERLASKRKLSPEEIVDPSEGINAAPAKHGLKTISDSYSPHDSKLAKREASMLISPRENEFSERTWWMVDVAHGEEEEDGGVTTRQGATALVMCCMRVYGWSEERARKVLTAYRQFLTLKKEHQDWDATKLSPSLLVDQMWKQHILDVVNYYHDMLLLCGRVVGYNRDGMLGNAVLDEATHTALEKRFPKYDKDIWGVNMESEAVNTGNSDTYPRDNATNNNTGSIPPSPLSAQGLTMI